MPSYVNNAVSKINGKIEKHKLITTIKNKRIFGIILYMANVCIKTYTKLFLILQIFKYKNLAISKLMYYH